MASASEQARGIAVLLSWLKAVGEPGVLEGREIKTSKGVVSVDKFDLAALAANGMEEFHKVTQELGLGQPIPVSRGPAPQFKDLDLDLVAFRHTEYRAAPDLSPEELSKYNKCIDNCVNIFFRNNMALLRIFGMGKEDLRTYAIVWTTNFCHRYQKDNDAENKKLLTAHLKQRFSGLRSLIVNRVGDVTMWPDELWQFSSENRYGDSGYEYANSFVSDRIGRATYPDCATFPDYDESLPDLDADADTERTEGPIVRRRAAKKALRQHLDALGPEKARELLEGFSQNIYVHSDVRLAAKQLLETRAVGDVDEQA